MSSKEDQDDFELPDPKAVNEQIRNQARLERSREKQRRKNIGGLRDLAQRAVEAYPNDTMRQLEFMANNCRGIPAAIGRARPVSRKRERDLIEGLGRCIKLVREAGGRCTNVTDFGRKHFLMVMAEIDIAVDAGDMQLSTVKQYISVMKRMTEMLGKKGAVPEGAELVALLQENGISAGTVRREYVAELAKGWRDQGHDVDGLFEKVRQDDPLAHCWFELMLHFGLRRREVLCLQPQVCWKGTFLHVFRGTKGGKRRDVPLFKEPQRRAKQIEVIERAIQFAKLHPKGEMGVPGLTLEQSLERLSTVCRKHGITKSALGIVPHGLRHQFGCDLLTDHSGLPAPVLRKLPAEFYAARKKDLHEAMLHVSLAMGHERAGISGAYTGTFGKLNKSEVRLRKLLEQLKPAGPAFGEAGVVEAWLVGGHAAGLEPRKAGALIVAVQTASTQVDLLHLKQLSLALQKASALPAYVTVVDARPSDGVEILFAQGDAT